MTALLVFNVARAKIVCKINELVKVDEWHKSESCFGIALNGMTIEIESPFTGLNCVFFSQTWNWFKTHNKTGIFHLFPW